MMVEPLFCRLARGVLLVGGLLVSGLLVGGCAHTRQPPPPPAAVAPTKPDHEQALETEIPIASTPQGLMKDGAEEKIQRRLRAKGFLPAAQSTKGQLDQPTREGLRRYQKSEGLPATGLPSYETVSHLGLSLDAIFHTTAHPKDVSAGHSGAE